MGFHTPPFFLLTVVAFALFWSFRGRRIWVLAIFDCLFYLYAGPLDFGLFFGASVISYLSGIWMGGRRRKLALAFGLGLNLINLAFFKYYYFVLDSVSRFAEVPSSFSALKLVLPIGISFYTFQLMAYLIDVYRDDIPPIKSFLEFWVFISFFGQVIAGPIMRAGDFAPQVAATEQLRFDPARLKRGAILFAIGLGKKLLLADTLSPLVDKYFARGATMSSWDIWIAAYLFAFQIYYDFSAYSDMALGIGDFFGYDLTRNFDTPYMSQNPQEFWRRWHVTLSTWIKDYIYIPLGGSRKGFARGLLAVVFAMTLSGLWHGASWTFVLWGLYHGLLSAGHRVWRKVVVRRMADRRDDGVHRDSVHDSRRKEGVKIGSYILGSVNTLLFFQFTVIGWVFFRVTNAADLGPLLSKMLTFGEPGVGPHALYYVVLIGGLAVLHVMEAVVLRYRGAIWSWWETHIPAPARGLIYAAFILVLCVFLRPKANAFIYFQF